MFKTILWDFDGVILDSMKIRDWGFEEVFKNIEFYEIGSVNSSNKLKINGIEILREKLTHSFKKTLDGV